MFTYTTDFIALQEGTTIVLPGGAYRVLRLADGSLAAASVELSDIERNELEQHSAQSLAQNQPEIVEVIQAQIVNDSSGTEFIESLDEPSSQLQLENDLMIIEDISGTEVRPDEDIIIVEDEPASEVQLDEDIVILEDDPPSAARPELASEVQSDEDIIILEDDPPTAPRPEPANEVQSYGDIIILEDDSPTAAQPEDGDSLVEEEEEATQHHPQERRYFGVPEVSMMAKHPVLLYRIPDSSLCYTFAFQRITQMCQVYRCTGCYEQRDRTYTRIEVVREIEFVRDPCRLDHVCIPVRWNLEKSQRIFYQRCQTWRMESVYTEAVPKEEYLRLLYDVKRDARLSDEEKAGIIMYLHDYSHMRKSISRNLRGHEDRSVTMDNVPDELGLNPDGTRFLQVQAPDLHIYYVENLIRKACQNGLDTVVADGVFGMHPDPREPNGQLYTLHGVCNGKVDFPMVYAIASRKTEETYLRIWNAVKDVLERTNGVVPELRVVLDFERAAIKAVRRVFPAASLEGCAFHLARAWNRKRDELGLRKHLRGRERSARVKRWWNTLKGIPFLPPNLYYLVHALHHAPVPPTHPAHDKCRAFLSYLQDTWFNGPFKDTWNKWDKDLLRTTNVAEGFHSSLATTMRKRRPSLRKLLEVLHGLNAHAEETIEGGDGFEKRCSVSRKRYGNIRM